MGQAFEEWSQVREICGWWQEFVQAGYGLVCCTPSGQWWEPSVAWGIGKW